MISLWGRNVHCMHSCVCDNSNRLSTFTAVINSVDILFSIMVFINYTYKMIRRLIFSRSRQHLAVYIVCYELPNKYFDHRPANTCQKNFSSTAEVIEPSIYMLENYRHSLIMNRQSFTNKGYKGINKKNVQCRIIFATLYSVSLRTFDR